MDFAILWAVVFCVLAVLFLIVLIFLRYFKSKLHARGDNGLFGDTAPHYFKGLIKRINPFLIMRKRRKNPKLGAEGSEEKFIVFQDIPLQSKEGIKKPRVSEGTNQRRSVGSYNRKSGNGAGLRREVKPFQKFNPDLKEFQQGNIKKERILIKVDDLNSLSKKLKSKDLAHVLEYLKKEDYSLIERLFIGKTFNSENEFMRYLKEEIVRFLESEAGLLRERVSALRKNGLDMNDMGYKVMSIPLKIKLFSATFNRNDFDKVILMIDKIDGELKQVESARESAEKKK